MSQHNEDDTVTPRTSTQLEDLVKLLSLHNEDDITPRTQTQLEDLVKFTSNTPIVAMTSKRLETEKQKVVAENGNPISKSKRWRINDPQNSKLEEMTEQFTQGSAERHDKALKQSEGITAQDIDEVSLYITKSYIKKCKYSQLIL